MPARPGCHRSLCLVLSGDPNALLIREPSVPPTDKRQTMPGTKPRSRLYVQSARLNFPAAHMPFKGSNYPQLAEVSAQTR